ncbi:MULTISPECIES: uroporphyrinogen-III synthase [unclassified Ketobacter]|uniref:uroporphyrinogen-III synthase n=1 Tax=unclassified Ketobacter TaxID=2639109 RepID=UPI0025C374A2|nr:MULTISPECIES: uroporphyrinogen-III synthase [unclassified Ketobacter]MEC8813311.1 uroporphyrinogen-III synthase [Pseudomonadota bacterium]
MTPAGPLSEAVVLVTRPRDQAEALTDSLQQAGARVIELPTLDIEPLEIGSRQRALVLDLDQYAHVICVSPNAARLGLEVLADYWPQWPVQQQWAAVGPATGAAMSGWGLNLKVAQQGATSETLLDWPELQHLTDQRVLILRGEGGRETLAETLRRRGARVDYLELYRRIKPSADVTPLLQALQQQGLILTVTSGDGLRNLMAMVGEAVAQLQQCPLVVVSARLAQFAREQGFLDVWQANSPAASDMIQAITAIQQRE